jgi:iron(III) transport system substrate-binding protein
MRSGLIAPLRARERRTFVRRPLAAALAAAMTLALTACGGGTTVEPGASPTADSDGKVTVYSGRNETLVGPILTRAGEALGLQIDVRYGSTSEMAAQMLEEGDRTPADLFLAQDAGALGEVANAGLFTALPQETLDVVAPTYRSQDGTWVGVTGRARAFVIAPELSGSAPTSVYDLTEPQWRGQVGISPVNGSFQSFVTAMREIDGEERAEQWLRDMQANGVKTYEGNSQIVEAVASGQIKIGLVNHYYLQEVEKESGTKPNAELAFAKAGDPGSLVNISGVGMTTKGAQDPDALALIDYLLGNDAQTYFAEETNEYPLGATDARPIGVPGIEEFTPLSITLEQLADLRGTLDLLQKVGLV